VEVTQLISIGLAGAANNQSGHQPTHTVLPGAGAFIPFGRQVAISQDSGFAAFTSSANDLIFGDTNGVDDIYLRNQNGSVTTRISLGAGGIQATKASFSPVVSADGRYIAFASLAENLDPLLPADLSSSPVNIFRRDRVTGTTELVNVCLGLGCIGGTKSLATLGPNQLEIKVPSMSDDGRFIAWTIGSSNGAAPVGGSLFIRDMSLNAPPPGSFTGASGYVFQAPTISGSGSNALLGEDFSGPQLPFSQVTIVATLSGDGKVIAFITDRAHIRRESLPPPAPPIGDLNCDFDVYVGEVNLTEVPNPQVLPNIILLAPPQVLNVTRVTAMPDVCPTGQSTNRLVRRLALSRDGRFIAYATSNDELNGGDTNQKFDVYVYDRVFGTKELVSVANGTPAAGAFGPGVLGVGDSFEFSISDDGNLVTFLSDAPNLVATDANGTTTDVFVRNRATRQTLLVSKSQSGVQPGLGTATRFPVISGDGRGIAFSSDSGNLIGTADTNGFFDVFLACSGAGATCP
jgi:Tol biopolymer transport system component